MTIFDSVKIPDSQMCKTALTFVQSNHDPFLLNHVLRTFYFGAFAGQAATQKIDMEMLFLGSVLHDLGLVEDYVKDERFEIDGADGAAEFLRKAGYAEDKIEIVWDAIALHSTLGIPQRKRPEIALVQFGAGIDVGAIPTELIDSKTIDQVIDQYPRIDFKNMMLKRVGEVVARKPETTMHNFTADVAAQHVEGFERLDFCNMMHCSAFPE